MPGERVDRQTELVMQYRLECRLPDRYPSASGVPGVPALRCGGSPAPYGDSDDFRGLYNGQTSNKFVGNSAACSGRKRNDDTEGDR